MDYKVTHENSVEVHRIEIQQYDLVQAGHRIDKTLYSKYRLSPSMADRCLALALIVKAVEDENADSAEQQTPENVVPFNGQLPNN